MIPSIRKKYNAEFTQENYQAFLKDLDSRHPGSIEFRVAETPIFVPKYFTSKMLNTCESIVDLIKEENFKKKTERAIPKDMQVPNENDHPHFICFDFGICINEDGEYEPQLIEMQGFPSLFAYEALLPEVHKNHFYTPGGFSKYLNGFQKESYIQMLKDIILKNEKPENVILLEVFPEKQKTRVDFFCTEDYLGVKPVCLTKLIREGNKLFYMNNGVKTEIRRIYNRLIFDDLMHQSPEVQEKGKVMLEDLDLSWVTHPNWFYRISKFTLPFIRHPYVPKTYFLNEVKQIPSDLENYVLKPLFSFAGQGVVIDVKKEDIEKVKDPENWILQQKVNYADVIQTPDIPAKAEIRIFYFWEDGASRPVAANNLARMSKGKMIGVRYNKDKEWVGGTFCLFEE